MLISFSFKGDSLAIHAMLEGKNWSFSFFLVARSYLKTWGCLNLSSVNILHHSLVSPAMYIVVMESYYFFKVWAALKILLHILKEILKILCIVYTLEVFQLRYTNFHWSIRFIKHALHHNLFKNELFLIHELYFGMKPIYDRHEISFAFYKNFLCKLIMFL